MARPANLARWAETGGGVPSAEIAEPASGKKDTGWLDGEMPPHNWFNWWMWQIFQWIKWIAAKVPAYDEANTFTQPQHLNGAGTPIDAGWDFTAGTNFASYQLIEKIVTNTWIVRRYMGLGSIITTFNARWDEATGKWFYDAGAQASRYDFVGENGTNNDFVGVYSYRISGAAPAGWVDGAWGTARGSQSHISVAHLHLNALAPETDAQINLVGDNAAHKLTPLAHSKVVGGSVTSNATDKLTAAVAGTYRIRAGMQMFNGSAGGQTGFLYLFKNGAAAFTLGGKILVAGEYAQVDGEVVVDLLVNDFVEIYYGFTNAGGNWNAMMSWAQFTMERVG